MNSKILKTGDIGTYNTLRNNGVAPNVNLL